VTNAVAINDVKILEFDAGNTRIKWRLRNAGAPPGNNVEASGAVFAREKTPAVFLELCGQFTGLPMHALSNVLVSNVRGEGFKTAFSALLSEKWQLQSTFVTVQDAGLIRHGYDDPSRLGVDRWLAMLAAYARHRQPCVVVDFGTTVTVDMINAEGQHVGGYIVPGLQLMKSALMQRSRALEIPDQPWGSCSPGLNTSDAIHHGLMAMVTGFVRDLHNSQLASRVDTVWVLTGGDAALFQPLLPWPTLLEPDLVMDGLQYSQDY